MRDKKKAILASFREMNIARLENLLDASSTYQDHSEEVFLDALNRSFTRFKENNNSKLTAYKGGCCSKLCAANNTGCKGYSFRGNNTKHHMDLIFTESDTDFTNIYNCNNFSIIKAVMPTDLRIEIYIPSDEVCF